MAHPRGVPASLDLPGWKAIGGGIAAWAMGVVWLVAGLWKITDPLQAAERMRQALVPGPLSVPAALAFGTAETFAGAMLLVPRFRRWGAWLSGALLLAFLGYFAINYGALRGLECNCFPWIKRTVGPAFFIGDAVLLGLAALAGWWARPSLSRRGAAIILGAVAVFAVTSWGVAEVRQTGKKAPDHVTTPEGQQVSLQHGRVVIYFFDPQCSHCDQAARDMARYNWKDTRVVGVPTVTPEFARQFLDETGLKAVLTNDVDLLRKAFPFGDPPYGVALENGRQKAPLTVFEQTEPKQTLAKLGFVE